MNWKTTERIKNMQNRVKNADFAAKIMDADAAAVLVPMGALFSSGSTGGIRQKLVDDNLIEAIIEFPMNMMMPYASVAAALVILKKNKMNDDIVMINSKDFLCGLGSCSICICIGFSGFFI